MEHLPLTVLIGPQQELVTWEGEVVAGLTAFKLDGRQVLRTSYSCANCFPRPSGHRVQDIDRFPLRIYADDDVNHIRVSYEGRPISNLGEVYIELDVDQKRIVRLLSYVPFPEDLNTALLDLGVEVIVQPPDSHSER